MFEGYVVYYLNQYLGKYVDGIDQKSLRISIYKGDVVLRNLQLRPDALASLDLPVTVRAGLLGSLTLKVPWSSLGTVPVEVKIDRLYLLASPKSEEERGKGVRSEDALEPAYQAAKAARVEAQEARWVQEMAALSGQQGGGAAEGGAPPEQQQGGGVGGMLKAVIDTVIGNLQLSISNVHVRYEDGLTNPGHPFACGITLDRISGYTVDEAGKEAFITNNPLQMLRKALRLRRMALYFDTDAEFWAPDAAAWRGMAPHEWDDWFQPGISVERQERGGTARHRQYVLQPVDGRALYTRRGAGVRHKEDEPLLEMDFQLDVVAVRLSQPQYQSYQLLLSEVSSFTARLGHNEYRPLLRPAAGEPARLWWRYAARAVQQQLSARKLTWSQAISFAQMRVAYVPAYADYLRSKEARAREELRPPRLPQPVRDMDLALPEQTILMFRRMAHAKIQREKRRQAAQDAAAGQAKAAGGWLGWLTGGSAAAAAEARARAGAGAGQGGEAPELTAEEYNRLVELVSEQEQGLRHGNETPFTLLSVVTARVGSASALLVGADGTRVLRGGLEGIELALSRYPETLRVELGVAAMGVESPEGTFIRTGAQLHRLRSDADLGGEPEAAAPAGPAALTVTFVQKPQDGSADALLDAVLTPSYVYYTASTVDRVVGFFRMPSDELDFSSLSAQATSQLERARRLAAQYAAAALQSRPQLKLHLVLDGPKVAVPATDAKGAATLALDFGRFIVESDMETHAGMSADEAALYWCMRLSVCDVAAYVADGAFDWQRRDEALQGGQLVPLLERTGMDIALQAARFVDPRYPVIRLQPSIPRLHFYLSPGRMGRLLRVIRAALPAGEGPAGGGAGGPPPPQEAWRQHAEYEGVLRVLTWSGLGRTSAAWCPRFGVLYQGKLYLYDSAAPGAKLAAAESVWGDRRAVRVPPDKIGGVEHVVALCPEGLDMARLADSGSCVVLRLDSDEAADAWCRRLQQAQAAMQELAGEHAGLLPPDWEEASSTVSGPEGEEAGAAPAAASPSGAAPAQPPTTVLQVDAQLGELALFGSGRQPNPWWPPEDGEGAEGGREPAARGGGAVVNVDAEVALIVLRASSGTCAFTYGAAGMTVHTALGSLEIEDLLVGPRCPRNRFLASSIAGVESVEDETFFDADERLAGGMSPRSSSASGRGSALLPSLSGGQPAQDLAEFTFKLLQPGGPGYEGVDTSLDVSLSSLYFYCNRPTVAALITMGLDVGAAASAAFGEAEAGAAGGGGGPDADAGGEAGQVESPPDEAGAATALTRAADPVTPPPQQQDEPALDPAALLGGAAAAAERSTFRLTASLGTLQVRLNYEGADCLAVSQASMDRFSFSLDVKPDTRMRIQASLGNMQAADLTLPPEHPYHQACGLRAGSSASLVSLEFCSLPPAFPHPAVPAGLQYYTLKAHLSELQLVFLYRFLQENLTYISTMLAMRLPPPDQQPAAPPAAPASPRAPDAAGGAAAQPQAAQAGGAAQQAPLQPFVLLLDVTASAPNILLPRNSDSLDAIEVDLGELALQTGSILSQPLPRSKLALLTEAVGLRFSGVGCLVVQNGKRGGNLFQNAESGWQLRWRRPLQQELRGEQPAFDMSLEIPLLKASLNDLEYQLITSVAADNFSELPELAAGPAWITDHYQAILLAQQQALLAAQQAEAGLAAGDPGSPRGSAGSPPAPAPLGSPSKPGSAAPVAPAAAPAALDKSPTNVRVVVSLGEVELEVQRHLEGQPGPLPLARFTVAELWVAFRNTAQGSMFVNVCVPRVEARDLRPEVPLEQSQVISSGHKASFLMLDWAASAGMSHQALALTVQKPLLVAELSFLLAVTQFVVPTFAFVKSRPIPWVSHDVALAAGAAHDAADDLFLCPAVRLLADGAAGASYEYSGHGHRLVLPDKDNLDEPLPLVLVGAGCTLRLRDVRVVNAASLAACLQLAPGAQLLASPEDGVELVDGAEAGANLARQLTPSPLASPPAPGSLMRTFSPRKRPSLEARSLGGADAGGGALGHSLTLSRASQSLPQPHQQPVPRTIEMAVSAVGVSLQFVHLEPSGGSSDGGGARHAGSGASSGAATRQGSMADISLAQVPPPQLAAALATAPASARGPPPAGRSVQMLSASLDLGVAYRIEGDVQSGHVELQGLRAETRFISDAAAKLAQREQQDMASKRKLRGKREGTVLEPCRLALDFTLAAAGAGPDGPPARTDVRLDASDIRLTLSPDVLELGSALAASVLAPLMQPTPDKPLVSCTQFERVWSFDAATLFAGQLGAALAVSLAVTGAEGGVTVWRPKTPTGYGVAGDVVTPGDSQPTFEVLAVAANSGLAAYPTGYTRVWAGAGGAIWRPQAPPGYVAAGDLVTTGGEPELSDMVCLHEGTVVEASPGERLTLPPQLPHAPAVTAAAAAALPRVELWCVDSSLGTFLSATEASPAPCRCVDLRNPLGLTPAALLAMGAAVVEAAAWAPPGQPGRPNSGGSGGGGESVAAAPALAKRQDPSQMFRSFQSSRRELRTEAVARLVAPTIVDFRRLWAWDGDAATPCPEGVSLWRPLPPAGYASLGDCLVRGHDPPPAVCVVQDAGAREGFGAGAGQPLVKAPRGFEPAWEDASSYADTRLVLWRPIPYPGYVAMGCVATLGTDPPPRSVVKCLRADATARAPTARSPTWAVSKESRSLPPLAAWPADDRLSTFVVTTGRDAADQGPPQDVWKMRQPSSEQSEVPVAQQASGGVNVVVKASQASLLLQDPFHLPLLEVALGGVEAGVRGPSQAVVQAYLGFRLGVWAYNGAVKFWEPVVEPWDVIAQCAANHGTRMSAGIEPGVSVSVKTSNDCVYTTLAFSAVSSLLAAYSDWHQLHGAGAGEGRGRRALLAAGDAAAMHVQVDNRLGVEAAMELDFGDRLELVKLPAGAATPVVKPLPSIPMRHGERVIGADALPHDLLLLDVQQATCAFAAGGAAADGAPTADRQLYCRVRLEGPAAPPAARRASPAGSSSSSGRDTGVQAAVEAPVRTRALPPGDGGVVAWQERLILAVPMRRAPGEQTLVLEVWDAAASGGRGASLGAGRLAVPVRSLQHREQQTAEVSWEAGGPAGQQVRVTLQLGYMLQVQWSFAKAASAPPQEAGWSAELSTAGQRALSLVSQPGDWSVIPAFGQQKAAASSAAARGSGAGAAGSASLIPLQIGSESLVVESSVSHGSRRELLRALCQLVNTTELTLEACMVEVEDGDWHMVPSRSGSVSGAVSADSVEEEVFENERFARGGGGSRWSAANLAPGDPRRFSFALRESDTFPQLDPPPGWEWESTWQVDHGPATDADGWAYGPDLQSLHFPPPPGAEKPGVADFVRRRRWVRRRRRAGGRPAFPVASAALSAVTKAASALGGDQPKAHPLRESELVIKSRQLLGRAAPGDALPLPLGWSAPGKQLQLRPLLPVAAPAGGADAAQGAEPQQGQAGGEAPEQQEGEPTLRAVHNWSHGTAGGWQTVALDSLSEGVTRLVCCPSLRTTPLGSSSSELEAGDLWFSLLVDADILAGGKQAQPLTDWRIVVSAPLRLCNQLPVPGTLLVWEQQAGTKDLIGRQTLQVPSGGTVPVHTADMRRVVSFTFFPEGYEWTESAPAVLSEGYSGRARGRQQLPDRFRLARASAAVPVEIFIHRTVELGAWLLDATEELDPGAAAAMGVPLSVSLLAPLWVVNATSLAVDAVVVPLEAEPPKPAARRSLRRKQSEGFRAESARTLKTDDGDPAQRGDYRGRRFVAPCSMELLSYPLPALLAASASQQQLGGGGAGSAEQQAARQRAQARQQYGVRLRVAGSGWTPPLPLDVGEQAAGGGAAVAAPGAPPQPQEGKLEAVRPVVVRALVREQGLVHEVVARLEVTVFGTSQVLRLEPHVVVSNRTAVPLQLLQSRLEVVQPAGSGPRPPASGPPAGAVVAEGGASFTQASRGPSAAMHASAGSFLVRPSMRSLGSTWADRTDSTLSSVAAESLTGGAPAWERVPSLLLSGSSPLVQLPASSFRLQQERGAVTDLPAGASSAPLHLTAGLPSHTLSFRCVPPPEYAAAAAADALPLWSRPVEVLDGVETQLHVVVPVIAPDEPERPGGGDAAHLTAGTRGMAGAPPGGGAGWPTAVAVLRLSVHRRGPAAMHVVLESVHSDPPFLLENRTPFPLQYRQAHVAAAPLHGLAPFSAAGYVWEYSLAGAPLELELQEAGTSGAARRYALDGGGGEGGEGGAPAPARAAPLPLSVAPAQCSVRVAYWEQVTTGPGGVAAISGEGSGVLGRGGIDRVLLVAPGNEPLLAEGAPPPQAGHSDVTVACQLPGLEVSLVDHQRRELLLLSATDLRAGLAMGANPASTYKSLRVSVHRLQLDDMLSGTPFPVVLAAAKQQAEGGCTPQRPVLALTVMTVLGGARGRTYMPLVAVRWPLALQLAVSESLVWSVQELVQRLSFGLAAAGEGGGGRTAAADVPVRIRLLWVDTLRALVSFQGDPFSRPRDLAGGLLSSIIDLANFQAAPVSLAGLAEPNVSMLQSALTASLLHHLRSQLFYVTLSLLRNFGLIGGTSRALGALSAAVSKLAAGKSAAAEQQEAKQRRAITDVGDGMLEGAGAIGSSVLRGFRGLVEKPLQGAKAAGVEGAVKGIGRGLLGAVANPVSGMLDALSATAQGFDATFGKPKEQLLVVERRRPARVVSGDGKLLPLVRDGSTKQSRIEEIGQALLRNSLLAAPAGLRAKRQGAAAAEAYEEHFVLPDDRVVLLTSAGILLVHAPGFGQLDGAAEIGAISVSDVAPGQLQWTVRWDDVLAFELRWSRELRDPDRLVVHRKGTPGWQEEESLAHEIRCFEGTPQASQVKLVAQKVLRKWHLDPLRRNRAWSRRHDAGNALPPGTPLDQLPLTMPCLDFVLTWHTNLKKSPVVSFWRPLAPAGYRAGGDVLSVGLEPPAAPVPCFRDDLGLHIGTGASTRDGEPPPTMRPREFSLIWRYNGKRPVTVWMPAAPPGYAALGAVVRGEPEAPATEDYLCIRTDLTASARVFNSPIWKYDPLPALQAAAAALAGGGGRAPQPRPLKPHHPETWKVSVWQVDNRMGTFIAVRAFAPPPEGVPRTVLSLEERAASKQAAAATAPPVT